MVSCEPLVQLPQFSLRGLAICVQLRNAEAWSFGDLVRSSSLVVAAVGLLV